MGEVDQVGLRVVHQRQGDGIQTVDTAQGGLLLDAEIDVSHIFEQDGAFGDDNVLDVGNTLVFRGDMNIIQPAGFMEIPGKGPVEGIGAEGAAYLGAGDAISITGCHVDSDFYGALFSAIDSGGGNPVNILEFIDHLLVDYVTDTVGTSGSPDLDLHKLVAELIRIDTGNRHGESFGKGRPYLVYLLL